MEKADLKAQLAWKEAKLKIAKRKTSKAIHLLTQFNNFIEHSDDIVTKARLFDEAMMKLRPLTGAKVIHIMVDYTVKMDKLFEEITLYSLKWENGLIMRVQAWGLKSHGVCVCTYNKSKHCRECNKFHFSTSHKFQQSVRM